ncbi:MAG: hypothetical protein JWO68_2395 [Actinomycetia bacterium]|nr:hypothetical protein [Actinomycetes bacterium]
MGKASSSKKVARAARAAGRPGAKQSYAWPMAIGAVVILGVLLVVLSFGGKSDAVAPRLGDHWHAAYGIYDCDHFIAPLTDAGEDTTGVHTHGEGLMHIHPFSTRVSGKGANIGAFLDDTGGKVSDTSIDVTGLKRKNGDTCGAKAGHMELWVWDNPADSTATVVRKDLSKWAPQDQSIWVLAFVPTGTKPAMPQSALNLQDPKAVEEGRNPAVGGSSTTVPAGATSTTVAPGSSTTEAPSTTQPAPTTTAAP